MIPPTVPAFQRRWYVLIGLGALFAVAVGLCWAGALTTWMAALPAGRWPLLALGLLLVWLGFFWLLWRCPACRRFPGLSWGALDCRHCGVPLVQGEDTSPEEWAQWERGTYIRAGDRDIGGCGLVFPIATFCGALLIGLWDSLPAMRQPSAAPFWICLGLCALFYALELYSVRSGRRNYEKGGMPEREIRRRISGMWRVAGALMIGAGSCVFGYIALTLQGRDLLFGPVDHPLPLAITFSIYVMAGALLVGRSRRELREPENAPELPPVHPEDVAREAQWSREGSLHLAGRCAEGLVLVPFGGIILAVLIGVGPRDNPQSELWRWVAMVYFALACWFGVLCVRRSRRHLEAAGLSQEEVRQEIASTWITTGFLMLVIGAGALFCLILAADSLEPVMIWSMAGAFAAYTSTGALLLWRNRRSRRSS